MQIDYPSLIDAIVLPAFVLDKSHKVIAWNKACEQLTGVTAEQILNTKGVGKLLYGFERPCLADIILDENLNYVDTLYVAHSKAKFHNGLRAENWHDNINGKRRYLEVDAAPIYDEQGRLVAAIETLEDTTISRIVEKRLMLSDKVFTFTKQAILITDEKHRIIQCNQAFEELTGHKLDDIIGKTTHIFKSGKHDNAFYEEMQSTLDTTGHWEGEIWDKRKDGQLYAKWMTVDNVIDNNSGEVAFFISIFSDITEQKKEHDEIQHIAFHDTLTDLPNRLLLEERLQTAIRYANRSNKMLAVMFIDLDGFKAVNDTLGHAAGDELLIEVANRLKNNVRNVDTVARLSGDEFVVLLADIQQKQYLSNIAEKLVSILTEPYLNDKQAKVTPSIGIATYPTDGVTSEKLVENADKAMYQIKTSGKNGYAFYDDKT